MVMQPRVEGEGVPVVLVGGGLTGSLGWEAHTHVLSATRRVVRPQLLNVQHALEERPLPRGYSVRLESGALAGTLDELGLAGPLDLVAWDYGALVTLDCALDDAQRVRSLTLIEPPAIWLLRSLGRLEPEDQPFLDELSGCRAEISDDQVAAFVQSAGLAPPGKKPRELPEWPLWAKRRQALRSGAAVLEHVGDLMKLRAFRRPTLLVTGAGTTPLFSRVVKLLAELIPGAEVLELPGGHSPHVVSMDVFLRKLGQFQARAAAGLSAGAGGGS